MESVGGDRKVKEEIGKYRRDWSGKVEVGKCRKRLESKRGDLKLKEEIGLFRKRLQSVYAEIGSKGGDLQVYKKRFEWKEGAWNVQEETGKSRRRLESKGGYVKV